MVQVSWLSSRSFGAAAGGALIDHQFVFAAVAEERRQLADLLNELDEAQLATPSLCLGWNVKTVAAHVVSTVDDGMSGFLQMAIRRGSLGRGIDELARRRAQSPTAELVASIRKHANRPISSPVFGPLGPLADILVHSGDIRIALGLPFEPDVQLAALAMDFLTGRWPIGFLPVREASSNPAFSDGRQPGMAGGSRDQWAGRRVDDECLRPRRTTPDARWSGIVSVASTMSRPPDLT